MTDTELFQAVTANKLGHLKPHLKRLMKPAVRVTVARGRGKLAAGSSRVGGLPDMPANAQWPTVDGIPLMFAGQFDLRALSRFKAAKLLPKKGLLSFFFDGMLTGYDRGEAPDRSRVIYTDTSKVETLKLSPPTTVRSPFAVYREAPLALESTWTLPEFEEIDGQECPTIPSIEPILQTMRDRNNYPKLRRKIRGKHIGSKLFGYADGVQGGEIRFEAVLKQDRNKRFRREDEGWANGKRLVREMRDLSLLFQSAMGVTWGGMGVVYFWIRHQDLENGRFDRAFAQLQST
ncbi:YwqG family protein [Labilithrix luteola]|nr:YwqG family protein [Labilithrix luteola]